MPRYVLSLDVETYGKASWLPKQNHFTPQRCRYLDGIPPHRQVLCCSVTPCLDPRPSPSHPWTVELISQLRPLSTFTLPLSLDLRRRNPKLPFPPHVAAVAPALSATLDTKCASAPSILEAWLLDTDTLIGMNLAYDLQFLRYCFPLLARCLTPDTHPHLLDLSYIAFLEDDVSPERSLKDMGPVSGLYRYDEGDLERIDCPYQLLHYNAQDTHNAVLMVAHKAALILDNQHRGDKLSPFCISHFSSTIWNCVEMTAAGVPFHVPSLSTFATTLHTRIKEALTAIPFPVSTEAGPEPKKHRDAFMLRLLTAAARHTDVTTDPHIIYTDKTRELSFSEANRNHLLSLIPPSDPEHADLTAICKTLDQWSADSKLFSTYVCPLLWHARNSRPYKGRLVPNPAVPSPEPLPPCLIPPPKTKKPPKPKVPKTPKPRRKSSSSPSPTDPTPSTGPSSPSRSCRTEPSDSSTPPSSPSSSSPASTSQTSSSDSSTPRSKRPSPSAQSSSKSTEPPSSSSTSRRKRSSSSTPPAPPDSSTPSAAPPPSTTSAPNDSPSHQPAPT